MGFRFGWFGKWGGFTWGPRGGWRLYGWASGKKKKSATGCLIPFLFLMTSCFGLGALVVCVAIRFLR